MFFYFVTLFISTIILLSSGEDIDVRQIEGASVGPLNYSQYQSLKPYLGQDDSTTGPYNYSQYQPWEKVS